VNIAIDFRKHFTWLSVVVILNYVGWRIGIFLITYSGHWPVVAATILLTTGVLGLILIPLTVIHTLARRFRRETRKWDLLGPILAIFAALAIYIEFELLGNA